MDTHRSWRDAPWTLWGVLGVTILGFVSYEWVEEDINPGRTVVSAIVSGVITVGLFRGNRTAWGCALIPSVLSIFGALSLIVVGPEPIDYLVIALVAADLYLLLHPATRAWLRPSQPYRDSLGDWLDKK